MRSSKSYSSADIDSDHNLVLIKSVLKLKKLEKPKKSRAKIKYEPPGTTRNQKVV